MAKLEPQLLYWWPSSRRGSDGTGSMGRGIQMPSADPPGIPPDRSIPSLLAPSSIRGIGTAVPERGTEGQEMGYRESGTKWECLQLGHGLLDLRMERVGGHGPGGGEGWSLRLLIPMSMVLAMGRPGIGPQLPHHCRHRHWEPIAKVLVWKTQPPKTSMVLLSATHRMPEVLEPGRVK